MKRPIYAKKKKKNSSNNNSKIESEGNHSEIKLSFKLIYKNVKSDSHIVIAVLCTPCVCEEEGKRLID